MLCVSAVHAQLVVRNAWVRATVAQQNTAAVFMSLSAQEDIVVLSVHTPVAQTAELHMMSMEDNVMRMRHLPQLALKRGKTFLLKPGGYHVMLMDLKHALKEGTTLPLSFTIKRANGTVVQQTIAATVRSINEMGTGAISSSDDSHSHKHAH
ncbi:MAG: copper chaperone PCu(A)C [Ottowia sp.]|nr:copper chaperone PCu(A)C [Ottowia sp.]